MEKRVLPLVGFEPTTYGVKSLQSGALASVATADWWKKSELLHPSTCYNFPLIANCKRAPNGPNTCYIPTDRGL